MLRWLSRILWRGLRHQDVYVVIQLDARRADPTDPNFTLEDGRLSFVVLRGFWTKAKAEAEVARLAAMDPSDSRVYFWEYTRLG
jgi:hypothetical protein